MKTKSCLPTVLLPLLAVLCLHTQTRAGTPLRGFADLHTHAFANLGFGGELFFGEPFDPLGNITNAIGSCACAHHLCVLGNPTIAKPVVLAIEGTHAANGFPQFDGWPKHTSLLHQQMYCEWLLRAYMGGLRLLVVHAVNNWLLCELHAATGGASPLGCNDMDAANLQIQAVKDLEVFIATHWVGGWSPGWLEIAYSGRHARQIIERGHLAVVLGIEVDNLFNCNGAGCTLDDIRNQLDYYHDTLGVRALFPVHLFNNAFSGAAIYDERFNVGNKILTGQWFNVRDCSGEGIEFRLEGRSDPMTSLATTVFGLDPAPPYPGNGHCNTMGLTPPGEYLIRLMMAKGMIMEFDHMSSLALNRALEIAEGETTRYTNGYPAIVMGHTGFRDNNRGVADGGTGMKRSEGNKTRLQIERLRRLGGVVGVGVHQGKSSEIRAFEDSFADGPPPTRVVSRVANNCSDSSRTFAQAYLYAVEVMQGRGVALGSDLNGLAGLPGPRFGPEAGAGEPVGPQGAPFTYPIPLYGGGSGSLFECQTGSRTWNFNTDGLAHIGLYPDFIHDLNVIGVQPEDLEPLYKSAEDYVFMWEKAENRAPVAFAQNLSYTAASANQCQIQLGREIQPQYFNNGSYDPEGDLISFAIEPTGPFGPGNHTITLIVTDSFGASGRATANLQVLPEAVVITSLFNTGVNATRAPLADNAVDPHFTLTYDGTPYTPYVATASGGYPIPPWLGDNVVSAWISPGLDTRGPASGTKTYHYDIRFDLSGLNPADAMIGGTWAADDAGLDILINGVSTGQSTTYGFSDWTPFVISSGFVPGTNTLTFVVQNFIDLSQYPPDEFNPTGLRVDMIGSASPLVQSPVITEQPQSLVCAAGEAARFRVVVPNGASLNYQWRRNGANLAGQTSSTLYFPSVTAADAGTYDVVAWSCLGLTVSAPATLTMSGLALPGLYNSGVSDYRTPLPHGASDPHFRVFHYAPLPGYLQNQPAPVATSAGGYPIPPWLGDNEDSAWITPLALQYPVSGTNADIRLFYYITQFDTTGLDQSTASITGRWAVDNVGAEVLLNGQLTGNTNLNGYGTWTPFAITSGIRPGTNTLAFVVTNGGGPSGVRIELGSRVEANCLDLAGLAPTKTGNPWLWDGLRFAASTLSGTGKTGLTNVAGSGLLWTQVLRIDLPFDCDRADLDLTFLAGDLVIRSYDHLDYLLNELHDTDSEGKTEIHQQFRLCAAGLRWIELRLEGGSILGDYGHASLANLCWKRSGPALNLTAQMVATNRLALTWPSVMGEDYQLQAADKLAGPWQVVRTLTAPSSLTRLDVTNNAPLQFFRVRRTLCD